MPSQVEIDLTQDGEISAVPPAGSRLIQIDSIGSRPQTTNPFAPLLSHIERGRPLPEGSEARDILLDVVEEYDCCIAVFAFGRVLLPKGLAPRLCQLIGKLVGVLNLGGYRLRAL